MSALRNRVEHGSRSCGTGALLTFPPHSNIRAHAFSCNIPVSLANFNILDNGNNNVDVMVLESLFLYKTRPTLNDSQNALLLYVVGIDSISCSLTHIFFMS